MLTVGLGHVRRIGRVPPLAVVARVFDRVCADCNEPTSSSVAARCAGTLIRSFQRGIAEEEMLLDIGHAVLRS